MSSTDNHDDDDDQHHDSSTPLGLNLESWDVQAPSADFAERVLARVRSSDGDVAESTPNNIVQRSSSRRRLGIVMAGVTSLAIAAMVMLRVTGGPPSQGEAIAKDRIEVPLGSRALAVLEPGANVTWNGDDVTQKKGDVFYRVEPGKRFTVHTPAGDVEVKGTCFAVKVRPNALAFVAVYEGKVGVTHVADHVDLRAGESAQAGPEGLKATGATSEAEKAFDLKASSEEQHAAEDSGDPTSAANKNLVHQVSEYRSRLEAITSQKSELETKLKNSEDRLAAANDGSAPTIPHGFDLSPDDWKELAKTNTIKFRMPCTGRSKSGGYQPDPKSLNALGLQPSDGKVIQDAYTRSNKQTWDAIRPLCADAIGNAEVAEKIGPDTCIHLILDQANLHDPRGTQDAKHQVAEIRAGILPVPPVEKQHAVMKLFLAATSASKNLEDDLAQSYGPEEAHRLIFSDELCMGRNTFGGSGD